MAPRKRVIVIGSGFGGLAAAIRLAAKDYDVTIFEKRDKLGGRAYQYEQDGFKFDGGPTVITAPFMFDELFALAGRRREDYFQLVPLDPFYRIFNPQGDAFNYYHSTEQMLEEVGRWSPADRDGYLRFVAQTRKIFEQFLPLTETPFLNIGDMFKIIPDMARLNALGTTYSFVSSYIKHAFLRRVLSFHPLLVGGSPFNTPAIFTLIVQFEKEWGVHYAAGGTGTIVEALGRLFDEMGGRIHLNTEVHELVIKNRTVTGVRLADGTLEAADLVVCNGDPSYTYRYLVPEAQRRFFTNARIDRLQQSMSLMVIYFGTKRRYLDSKLAHHNIILNQRYRGLLRDIFRGAELPSDFSLYLHMPTITDASIAPPGCESFYVLSPVPPLGKRSPDWSTMAGEYKDRILGFLEENYLPGLRSNIITESFIDPLHFRNTLNSYRGAAFGTAPTLMQSSWFRPHNRSQEFANLYFVGAGTHPGAGVPAVLSSGKIVAQLIDPQPVTVGTPLEALAQ